MIFVSRLVWDIRKCLEVTWGGQKSPVSKLRPSWVEISTHTVRHKTAAHTVKVTNCRRNGCWKSSTIFSAIDCIRKDGSERIWKEFLKQIDVG